MGSEAPSAAELGILCGGAEEEEESKAMPRLLKSSFLALLSRPRFAFQRVFVSRERGLERAEFADQSIKSERSQRERELKK